MSTRRSKDLKTQNLRKNWESN